MVSPKSNALGNHFPWTPLPPSLLLNNLIKRVSLGWPPFHSQSYCLSSLLIVGTSNHHLGLWLFPFSLLSDDLPMYIPAHVISLIKIQQSFAVELRINSMLNSLEWNLKSSTLWLQSTSHWTLKSYRTLLWQTPTHFPCFLLCWELFLPSLPS